MNEKNLSHILCWSYFNMSKLTNDYKYRNDLNTAQIELIKKSSNNTLNAQVLKTYEVLIDLNEKRTKQIKLYDDMLNAILLDITNDNILKDTEIIDSLTSLEFNLKHKLILIENQIHQFCDLRVKQKVR
jgi:hypothetical protein